MMVAMTSRRSAWPWFATLAWAGVGALVAFGIAGLASIGLFLLARLRVLVAGVALGDSGPAAAFRTGLARRAVGGTAVHRLAQPRRARLGLHDDGRLDLVQRRSGAPGRSWRSGCSWPAAGLALLVAGRRAPDQQPDGACRSGRSAHRGRRLDDRDGLPRPRGDDPDAAGRARGADGAVRRVGNPSSLHTSGRAARAVVEEARERIGAALGARPSEVVFTSGGTESDNLAVKGAWLARRAIDPALDGVVASGIEHHAVLDPVEYLAVARGVHVTWLEPDRCGHIAVDTLREALAPGGVAVASVMWANNEVGTVQPVAELAAVAREHGVPFHTDAVQAVAHLPVRFDESGADLMTVSAHKIGGPVGVGALLARRDAPLVPIAHGGGQERQVRSGTLDAAGIHSFAVALEETVAMPGRRGQARHGAARPALEGALGLGLGITVSGCWTAGDGTRRLPGNAHLVVPGCEGDSLLYLLDAAGVECSTGSACQAGVPQPSHVLLAMGLSEAEARGALRLSLGHTSTEADVDAFLAALPAVVERARRAGGLL